jgi:D-alanine-D-alanine ligase
MSTSTDVVILCGGRSSERLVSVASAQNVSRALPEAAVWFWAKSGEVYRLSPEALAAHARPFEQELAPVGPVAFDSIDAALASTEAQGKTFFLGLHGGEGENGTLQARLEQRGLAFTASGSLASARAFDKAVAKQLVGAAGGTLARAHRLEPDTEAALTGRLEALFAEAPRWVLKPVADGSSFGLFHLKDRAQCAAAAAQLHALALPYLAEQFIEGRELTVGVVDDEGGPVALPPSEVRLAPNAAFDYAGKYLGHGTEELTPAPLTEAERGQAQALAVLAHRALGCAGYTRTDMILTPGGPVFLETNTLPGLTKASFIPQQLAAAQRGLADFLARQLALARARAGAR